MITRPISTSISRGISLAINEPNGAGFNPLSLFAADEQGVWYDPSDMSTLFQDSAGTIPVTAAGQPVGKMLDKSGRGNHATQTTATSRPILQTASGKWYLAFDGVDDWLQTGSINLTVTNKVTMWAGFTKLSEAIDGWVVGFGGVSVGSFSLRAPSAALSTTITSHSSGSTASAVASSSFPAPVTLVGTVVGDIAADVSTLRINGAQFNNAADQGTGSYGTFPLFIGRRSATLSPLNGRIYSLIVRGATSTAQQIADTESYVNSKTGAY